jgi:uncharacterized membrane protein YedE/YeeE
LGRFGTTSASISIISSSHFVVGIALGFVMHRSDFCIAGAFRDIFLFRDYFRMRSLFLLITIVSVLMMIGRLTGLIETYPPSFFGLPSLVNLVGGMLFGAGMVMGGGCMIGTLYKLGSGKLISAFAFIGILIGTVIYAGVQPSFRALMSTTTLSPDKTAFEHISGPPWIYAVILLLVLVFFLFRWINKSTLIQQSFARGYLQPWIAAVLMAVVIFISFVVSGRPLSVTMGFGKISGYIGAALAPDYVRGMGFFNEVTDRLVFGSILGGKAGPGLDAVSMIHLSLIVGIVSGSFFSAMQLREFKFSGFPPVKQAVTAVCGGVLMALGAFSSAGCNLWHMLGGLPVFAFQSVLFLIGVFPGAFMGTRVLKRVILSQRMV